MTSRIRTLGASQAGRWSPNGHSKSVRHLCPVDHDWRSGIWSGVSQPYNAETCDLLSSLKSWASNVGVLSDVVRKAHTPLAEHFQGWGRIMFEMA